MKNLFLLSVFLFTFSASEAQFSGAYTVDKNSPQSTTNFQSLAALADSINLHGVSGPVQIDVVSGSGPYNEQVWFRNIAGMDAFNSITLDGHGETWSAVTSTTSRHVLRVEGVSYFTITNFVINYDTTSSGGFYGVHVFNSADHVTVSNCTVNMTGNSTLHGGIIVSGSETSILDDGDFHFITITGNTTTMGGYGASVFGEVAPNLATNIVISNNTFYDWHQNGVYLRETDAAVIENNYLNKRDAMINSCNAIQLAQAANINGVIRNNHISISQTSNGTMGIRGIYLFNGTGHMVYNNLIDNIALTSGDFIGIEIRTGGTQPEILFNTIILDNANTTSGDLAGIGEELSNTNSVLRNNLVSITQNTSGNKAALLIGATSTPASALNSNYNILYVPGGFTCVKNALSPVTYSTLSNWQTVSGQDLNSWALDPQPVNAIPTNAALDNKGIGIAGITLDLAGNPRAGTPDIGAYEFLTVGIDETAGIRSFGIYPNPANDLAVLNYKGNYTSAELITPDGRLIQANLESGAEGLLIETSALSNGVYLVRISDHEKVYLQKMIVQH